MSFTFIRSSLASTTALSALLLSVSVSSSIAAPARSKATPAVSGSANRATANYKLGPQDVFRVVVKDFPEFNLDGVIVPPDGVVATPQYGTLRVGGKTVAQVQAQIRSILKREMRNPQIAVTVTSFRSGILGNVSLVGPVTTPGSIQVREGFRLTEVLAAAGGLKGRLSEQRATLTRQGQAPIALDLQGAVQSPNSAANLRVQPGDVLTIDAIAPGVVTITGDVARPDTYELHREPQSGGRELPLPARLTDALLAAGGLSRTGVTAPVGNNGAATTAGTNDVATNLDRARNDRYRGFVQRKGQRIELDIFGALRDISGPSNISLRAGDFLTIEAVPPLRILIDGNGFINRAGAFEVTPGSRILEVLTEAGGLTQPIEKTVATVRRGNEILPVDLNAVMLKSDSDANFELRDNDIVQFHEPEFIRVRMAGSVGKPGEIKLRPKSRLLEALYEAGELSIKPEDARLKVVRRGDDGTQSVLDPDPVRLFSFESAQNVELRDGDIINASAIKSQTVFLSGEVNRTGSFEIREGQGLAELITSAGGVTDKASLTRVIVKRGDQNIEQDIYGALREGKAIDFPLQSGDFVVVPENKNQVLVMEAVGKPGYYPLPERGQLTLLDVLGQAGGPSQRTKEIVLVRQTGGVAKEERIPIQQVRSGPKGRTVLQHGDVVYVPATTAKPGILTQLSNAFNIARIFGF